MIFGKTRAQKHKEEQTKIIKMINGVKKFAWLPTKLKSGRTVWLESFYVYYYGRQDENGIYSLRSNSSQSNSSEFCITWSDAYSKEEVYDANS